MKKILFSFAFLSIVLCGFPQGEKPHFASVNFYPVMDNFSSLKGGFGYSVDGAYFINSWFGAGGTFNHSLFKYKYDGYEGKTMASHFSFCANAYVKKSFGEKFTIMPNVGFGFSYANLPDVERTVKQGGLDVVQTVPGFSVSGVMFNTMSVKGFYNFYQDMSANVTVEYMMSVSNKWPEKSFGEFLMIGIGYTYYLNFNKTTK